MTSADTTVPEPTHHCVRCGRPVPLSVAMCDRCNPLGLADPAATQAHGTVFLAIGAAVVLLALVARFMLSGIGPFQATVAGVTADGNGLSITLTVTNQGARAGTATCRVHDDAALTTDTSAFFLSPQIDPGASATFTRQTTALGGQPLASLVVDCATP